MFERLTLTYWKKRLRLRKTLFRWASRALWALVPLNLIAHDLAWSGIGLVANVVTTVAAVAFVAGCVSWFRDNMGKKGEALAEQAALRLDAKSTIEESELVSGFLSPADPDGWRTGNWWVVLRTRDGDEWQLGVDTREQALAILELLGVDGTRRRLRFRRRRVGTVLAAFLAFLATSFLPVGLIGGLAMNVPILAGALAWIGLVVLVLPRWWSWLLKVMQPKDVVIGADGIRWRHKRVDRYLPHRAIRSVRLERNSLWATTDDGVVEIPMGPVPVDELAALVERVAALSGGSATTEPEGALQQGELDFEGWMTKLRRTLTGDYRERAVPIETLEARLEDPHAPAEQRVGAAVALMADEHARAKIKVRVEELARSVADPALEQALMEVAADRLKERTVEALAET